MKEQIRTIISQHDPNDLTAKLVRQKLEEMLQLPAGELTEAPKEKKKEISALIDEVLNENEAVRCPRFSLTHTRPHALTRMHAPRAGEAGRAGRRRQRRRRRKRRGASAEEGEVGHG